VAASFATPPEMRVLLINYELPPLGAGAGNATANIARHLAAGGDDVLVLTSGFRGLRREEQVDGYRVRRVRTLRRRVDRSTAAEMVSFIVGAIAPAIGEARRFRPEVTCSFFGLPSGPLALLLERLLGIPYLVSLRGGDVPGFLPGDLAAFHRVTGPVIRSIWRHSRGLIANGEGLATLAHQSLPEVDVRVIENGVDCDLFRPPDRERPDRPMRLLLVGRLVRQKAFGDVLTAVSKVRAPVVLRLVGDGPDRSALAELARRLGLEASVEFVGWAPREELPGHYQWADVFVLPSLEEGVSNAVLEAMAAGLPIVTTDVAGNRDLVGQENGTLVQPGDVAAIRSAIDELAEDGAGLRRRAAASRDRALGRRWETAAQAYRDALAAALP